MRRLPTILSAVCLVSLSLVLGTVRPVLSQEGGEGNQTEAIRKENEALRQELEALRRQLRELRGEASETGTVVIGGVTREGEVALPTSTKAVSKAGGESSTAAEGLPTTGVSYQISTSSSPERNVRIVTVGSPPGATDYATLDHFVGLLKGEGGTELKKWELENVTLSHGDAGLETMLRFEKAKICRKAGMLDKATEELKKIIEENIAQITTHAARLTLIEILLEQKKNREAIAEFEKILATAKDARSKRDALYGIINLSPEDPESKVQAIDRLLEKLRANPPEPKKESPQDAPPAAQ